LDLLNKRIGFAITGSFCTFRNVITQLKALKETGADITPIMSEAAYNFDTRFGKAKDIQSEIVQICEKEIINTIFDAEPIGPKKLFNLLIVAPCTGNTLGKLACGITDTTVTMACKAHLRNEQPLLLAISTNDALGASGKNIMSLMNNKNIYFVPFGQDDAFNKHKSLVADMGMIIPAACAALDGIQIQPILTK